MNGKRAKKLKRLSDKVTEGKSLEISQKAYKELKKLYKKQKI